jgi:ribonucleoside-diphosphate reductase alpha chain
MKATTVGLFEDGTPGELFITMAKEGSTIGGLMDVIGTETSLALQYGVPLEALVNKFSHARFEPSGWTSNPDIPHAKSVVDYIFRFLGITFIEGYREANAPNRDLGHGPMTQTHEETPTSSEVKAAAGTLPTVAAAATSAATTGSSAQAAPATSGTNGHGTNGHAAEAKATEPKENGHANGNGHGKVTNRLVTLLPTLKPSTALGTPTSRSQQFAGFQSDAPACDSCGAITVRNGNCYLCHNCGQSMGCS